jgi:uncharacterized protein YdaU (DUF1376 family)
MTNKTRRVDFYATDWIEGISDLDLGAAAVGVYWQICALCYARNVSSLPREETIRKIARQFGDRRSTIAAAVSKLVQHSKLTENGTEIEPKRVRAELERATDRREKFANAGSKGGKIKALAKASPSEGLNDALASSQHPSSISQHSGKSEAKASPRLPVRDRQFEDRLLEAAKIDPARWPGNFGAVAQWRNAGCTDDDILAGVATVAARASYRPPTSLNYFRQAIEDARDQRRASEAAGVAPPIAPARIADVKAERMAKHKRARDEAIAKGLKHGDPGWPKAEDFGLFWDTVEKQTAVIPGWKPETEGNAA